jgi:hypothetical protein
MIGKEDENSPPQKQESFYVDRFRPEDAEGIVRLFHAVYGESYPIRLFYDQKAIIAANQDGRYVSFVARTHDGKVIGTSHLYCSTPYPGMYENGVSLVLKEYRNTKAFRELLSHLYNEYIPKHPDIEEVWGQAVCNHTISQKMMFPFRFIDTALEVALMPTEAYAQEKSAAGRVATLDAFRCYVSKPHRIFLPPVYEEILRRIYERLDDRRNIALSRGSLPDAAATKAEMTLFDVARVARIAVSQAGHDFAQRMSELEGEAGSKNVVVFQVWLNLTETWVGEAVDVLRNRGYFFGGALPRWFDGDGLLMQKLECPPDFDCILLVNDFSKELLTFVREDRERCA